MCTAISWKAQRHYFGRNLDLEGSFGEHIAIVPRHMPLHFSTGETVSNHFAMIGTAHLCGEYPLFYDAANECGLCIAGLNFPENAHYGNRGIACYEIALWLLSKYKSAEEAVQCLSEKGICGRNFQTLPVTPLHFMIADANQCFVVEPMADSIHIHENPIGILTNNPPFEFQMMNLNNYRNLTPCEAENRFSEGADLKRYSRGMGAIGLPGDFSSESRFVRAAFVKLHSPISENNDANLMQFFHILESIAMPMGSVVLENGRMERTIYSVCYDADEGIYYYRTYENSRIHSVELHREPLDSDRLIAYPMRNESCICLQN